MTCKASNSGFCCRILIKAFLLIFKQFPLIDRDRYRKKLECNLYLLSNFNFDWFNLPIFFSMETLALNQKKVSPLSNNLHNFVPVIKKCSILLYPYSVRSVTRITQQSEPGIVSCLSESIC